jgi:hypothetical protein
MLVIPVLGVEGVGQEEHRFEVRPCLKTKTKRAKDKPSVFWILEMYMAHPPEVRKHGLGAVLNNQVR